VLTVVFCTFYTPAAFSFRGICMPLLPFLVLSFAYLCCLFFSLVFTVYRSNRGLSLVLPTAATFCGVQFCIPMLPLLFSIFSYRYCDTLSLVLPTAASFSGV